MVSKGKARGGGKQLFRYMLGQGENEQVELLHIGGTMERSDPYKALQEFELSSRMSGSKKGYYHGQISPAYEESLKLTDEQYIDMVYTHAKHMGYENPRVMVSAHYKNGHKHIHYALDRYDYNKGKLVSDSMDYYKRRAADMEIEQKYNLTKTPFRNPKRSAYKDDTTEAFFSTQSGQSFIDAMREKGYTVAFSTKEKKPLRLIDAAGTSSNLIRNIRGVKTDDVRQRLKDVDLPLDTDVIKQIRQRQEEQRKAQQMKNTADEATKKVIDPDERERAFLEQFMSKGKNPDGKKRGMSR